MKFSAIKCASIVILTAFTLSADGAVAQQPRMAPGVQPNDTALSQKVNALQAEVNKMDGLIKALIGHSSVQDKSINELKAKVEVLEGKVK